MTTSQGEQTFCSYCIQQGIRIDGRGCTDIRPVEVELGLIAQANGSARLRLGATDVLVGVKVEVGSPDPANPDCGRLQVSVECSACASPDYEGRGGEEWGVQLGNALEASLSPLQASDAYGINLRALNILTGKRCWHLFVDALVLNDDGNVLDALSLACMVALASYILSLACMAALANTRIPHIELTMGEDGEEPELELDDDMSNSVALDLQRVPLIVSVSQVGSVPVMDLTLHEEACASATLHVAVNAAGRLCGVTKEGGAGIDPSTAAAMVEVAKRAAPPVITRIQKYIAAQTAKAAAS